MIEGRVLESFKVRRCNCGGEARIRITVQDLKFNSTVDYFLCEKCIIEKSPLTLDFMERFNHG